MPRIQVYVPEKLKAAMDVVEKHRPNWSAVAQQAFEAEAARLLKAYGNGRKGKTKVK